MSLENMLLLAVSEVGHLHCPGMMTPGEWQRQSRQLFLFDTVGAVLGAPD